MTDEPPADEEKPPPGPRLDRSSRRVQAAADALRSTIRDIVDGAYNREDLPTGPVDLHLGFTVDPANGFALTVKPSIHEQVLSQFDELAALHGAYSAGHVYCFRCRNSQCEHAVPSTSLQVFAGYSSTGIPIWKEFTQVLLDGKDDRVDQLYARRPGVLTRVEFGKQLKSEQLHSFGKGSKTYAVLGQVVAGYFSDKRLRDPDTDEIERWAVTFQVVEMRRAMNRPGLALNVLCRFPQGGTLSDYYGEGGGAWMLRAQRHAEQALRGLERQRVEREDLDSATQRKIMGRIPSILGQLSTSLERGFVQSTRRTAHSDARRKQQRPVQQAVADASGAGADDLLHDEKSKMVVVRGKHGRFHVFTPDARHVTSFKGKPDTVENRVRRHRWRPLTDAEKDDWLQRLRKSLKSGERSNEST